MLAGERMYMPKSRRDFTNSERSAQIDCGDDSKRTIHTSSLNGDCRLQDGQYSTPRRMGILGGMGPESTMIYYRYMIREHYRQHGNLEYPEIVILSVDYQDYAECLRRGQWDAVVAKVTQALKSLRRAGVDYGLMACNTLHIVFDEIQKRSPIPLISIVEATSESIEQKGIKTVGLLGTALTMDSGVYKKKLEERGVATLVPSEEDKRFVDEVIRNELVFGVIKAKSRRRFIIIMNDLASLGVEGIILGCTEIPLLINQNDCQTQLFDTALIHVQKALAYPMVPYGRSIARKTYFPQPRLGQQTSETSSIPKGAYAETA